jgi:cyclase
MDVRRTDRTRRIPSGYEIVINDGTTPTGIDALQWAESGEDLGAGEVVVNSIDTDGMREGYELNLTRMIADAVGIPVIASGGAGRPQHLREAFTEGHADGAIVASILHYGEYTCRQLKEYLHDHDIKVRMHY